MGGSGRSGAVGESGLRHPLGKGGREGGRAPDPRALSPRGRRGAPGAGRGQRHPRGRQSRPAGRPCVCPARGNVKGRGEDGVEGALSAAAEAARGLRRRYLARGGPAGLMCARRRPEAQPPPAGLCRAASLLWWEGLLLGFGDFFLPISATSAGDTRQDLRHWRPGPGPSPTSPTPPPMGLPKSTSRVRGRLGGMAESGRLSGLKGLLCFTQAYGEF